MTPINDETLVRARILDVYHDQNNLVLLRLIDHGSVAWRKSSDIFEMKSRKDEMRLHPWQAIPIALFDVEPANKVCFYG